MKIVLGITGGIAAYKSAELVRQLTQQGTSVRVVLTQSGQAFITPLTLQTLSGHRVHDSLLDPESEQAMSHIELARWAEHLLIAPASANCIAKLACGIADDLLTTIALATTAPITLAPAMNQQMWLNQATQANIQQLTQRGCRILGPAAGAQACGEVGPGRMLEPEEIAQHLLAPQHYLSGKKVLITAGPTVESLDPVRYLSNHSSGKMGYALATAAQQAGAEVTLITGPTQLATPQGVTTIKVKTANEMHAAVMQHVKSQDIFIGAAAVADYRPADCATQKIKKVQDQLTLQLTRNPDIIADVASLSEKPFVVGFSAETENVINNARAKFQHKKLDMIIANQVGPNLGFDVDRNQITVMTENSLHTFAEQPKTILAQQLMQMIANITQGVEYA